MKARSPKLAEYLEKVGVLGSTDQDAIMRAKKAYRKEYKAAHKRKHFKKHHELRPQFTDAEYAIIQAKASATGLTPTAYIKSVSLAHSTLIPHKETLQQILQTVSMIAMRLEKEQHPAGRQLSEAENTFVEYLKRN